LVFDVADVDEKPLAFGVSLHAFFSLLVPFWCDLARAQLSQVSNLFLAGHHKICWFLHKSVGCMSKLLVQFFMSCGLCLLAAATVASE